MQKKYKVLLTIIALLIILVSGVTIYMKYIHVQKDEVTNKNNIVKNIKEYGYTLDDRDSDLMKEEFKILENILEKEEINYQDYAKSLSKLFIIDLFNMDNKINKYDVGSLEYIIDTEKDKFKNIILDTIYENIEDNSNHNRTQKLPKVVSVTVNEISESSYNLGEEVFESFIITLSWNYQEDMGYDSEAIITLVKKENKLYIVEYNPTNLEVEEDLE